MPFELENNKKEVQENLDWIYAQDYKGEENQATEALFKWFFFAAPKVQQLFLSKICHVRLAALPWRKLMLQARGKRGVPDAILLMKDGAKVIFEVKIKQNSVSRKQLKRHLKDAGLKRQGIRKARLPKLIVVTPDFREPPKVKSLSTEYGDVIEWVPWNEIMHFLTRLRGLKSVGRLLTTALLLFLKDWVDLKRYSP
jgi:hypothetical protein